ncbi:MAG: hypothetical protein WC511_03010 [Candidatus Pacearchaeota archaeon]
MAIRIPLVQINGRLSELPSTDKIPNETVATFEHEQLTPQDVWTIEHKMKKYPSVTIVLPDGTEVSGMKVYADENTVVLSFSKPIVGRAFLN